MRFKIENIKNSLPLSLTVSKDKDDFLEYPLGTLYKRKNEELQNGQFELLMEYIDTRGQTFKDTYWRKLNKLDAEIDNSIYEDYLVVPTNEFNEVINLFNYKKMLEFVKQTKSINIPSSIVEIYDETTAAHGYGTKEQTYTREQYRELIAFVLIVQAVIGPIAKLADINKSKVSSEYLEYMLYEAITSNPLHDIPAVERLQVFIKKASQRAKNQDEVSRVLKTTISSEDVDDALESMCVLRILAFSAIIDDISNKNLVTKMFRKINDFFKTPTGNKRITDKRVSSSSNEENDQSTFEGYRKTFALTIGDVCILELMAADIPSMIKNYNLRGVPIVAEDVAFALDVINSNANILDHSKKVLMGWIAYEIIPPKGIKDLDFKHASNLLAVMYGWLIAKNMHYLAYWLVSSFMNDDENEMFLDGTVENKIPRSYKQKMNEIFITRPSTSQSKESTGMEAVTKLITNINSKIWVLPSSLDINKIKEHNYKRSRDFNVAPLKLKLIELALVINNVNLDELN